MDGKCLGLGPYLTVLQAKQTIIIHNWTRVRSICGNCDPIIIISINKWQYLLTLLDIDGNMAAICILIVLVKYFF